MKKIIMLLTLLIFTACGKNLKDFENREFSLSSPHGEYKITMSFEGEKLYGFSGLNRYFGNFKLIDGKITISNLVTTKMAGSPEVMNAEKEYLKLLTNTVKYEILDETLIFYTTNNEKLQFTLINDK